VTNREPFLHHPRLHLRVQVEQTHRIRDGGAGFADLLGDVFLLELEIAGEPGKGARFFDGVEIFALKVLDQRQLEDVLIARDANDDGRFLELHPLRGAPSAFPGDELQLFADAPHDERLHDALFLDAVGKFLEVLVAELGARLPRRGHNEIHRDRLNAFALFFAWSRGSDSRVDQGAEALAERRFHHSGEGVGPVSRWGNAEEGESSGQEQRHQLFGAVLFDEIIEILDSEPHRAAVNMAIDEALLARASVPILRIYRWEREAISFGYFGRYEEVANRWATRDAVRRWTGGGIVLHGEDVTYSLIVPKAVPFATVRPGESYEAVHRVVAGWLESFGLPVSLTPGVATQSQECFANPAPHDIMAEGRKVSGAAQRRTRLGLLHQGSIQPVSEAVRRSAQSLAAAFSPRIVQRPLDAEEVRAADILAGEKYGTDAWLRRW
jgi:lipoyl(octanoyl) transferase